MATDLNSLCDALEATLISYYQGQGAPIQVYGQVPGAVGASPAIIVEPAPSQYHAVFGASSGATYALSVHVLVALGDRKAAQRKVNEIISPAGSLSVVAAVHSDRTLGGVVRWCDPQGFRDYGTREFEGTAYLMATVDLDVLAL